ncbi:hypothetical protein VUR80DRAFT_4221 [Thermomyces stellatus]
MDDEIHSDSTVVGGGAFGRYQELFGGDNAPESNRAAGDRADENRSRRRHSRPAPSASQARSSRKYGGARRGRKRSSREGGAAEGSDSDDDSGEVDSDERLQPCHHSAKAHSTKSSPRKNRHGRYNTTSSHHKASPRVPRMSNLDSGPSSRVSRGCEALRGRSKKKNMGPPSESVSDDAYDSTSGSSLHDSQSDSSDSTVGPRRKGTKPRRAGESTVSRSSSPGFSDNLQSAPDNRRSGKSGGRARSTSRVRFNPEVEVQNIVMRGSSGAFRLNPESYSMDPEEPYVPKYVGTLGCEPLKTQDGGRSTLREIDINAQREAARRTRSERVYDSMFGSALGGGTAGWKDSSVKAAGSPDSGPPMPNVYSYQRYGRYSSSEAYGKYGNGDTQASVSYPQEQSGHYSPYFASAGFHSYRDKPYNYQGDGRRTRSRGYYYDSHSQTREAQGYTAYCNGQAFAGPQEPACTETYVRSQHDAYGAHASSFSNAQ